MKKFYMGAKHIGNAIAQGLDSTCMRNSIDEAVEDAKVAVRRGDVETAVIVQIVAIVRRDHPPIVVERVYVDAQWDK